MRNDAIRKAILIAIRKNEKIVGSQAGLRRETEQFVSDASGPRALWLCQEQ